MSKQRSMLRARAEAIIDSLQEQSPSPALESERLALQARDLAFHADDRLLEAEALLRLGKTFVPSTNPRQVWELLHHAKSIFEANGLTPKVLSCRIALAQILFDMGEERNAITLAQKVLEDSQISAEDRAFAHILIAICHSHVGELDVALRRLELVAMPLARLCSNTPLVAQVKWAQGLTYIRLYMSIHCADLFRGWPDMPAITAKLPACDEIISLFDEAQAAMPNGKHWPYLDIGKLLAQGLMGPAEASIATLDAISKDCLRFDPPLAARTLFCKGLVLRRLRKPGEALEAFLDALECARQLQSWSITRDVLLNLSRIYEECADFRMAFETYKEYSDLRLRGLISRPKHDSAYFSHVDQNDHEERADHMRVLEPAFVKRATLFIMENLHRKISVDDVVDHCAVGRRTLENSFKEAKGSTIAQFIKNHKIRRASLSLLRTNVSVKQVSVQFGFQSLEVFSREFRSLFGCSPSRWRTLQGSVEMPDDPAQDL